MNSVYTVPPVAIFGFNRPDCTRQVFERVRQAKPRKLFLCLDAPRENREDDFEKCVAVKKIFEKVDWDCDVFRNYAERNMGCRERMATGITWVFKHVEAAVLLEDDCVPHLDFFQFCAELLEKYTDDTRVGMIAGHDEHFETIVTHGASYYFDRLATICGWATWRRAWIKNKPQMEDWLMIDSSNVLLHLYGKKRYQNDWRKRFYGVYVGRVSSWATAWALTMAREHWLCIHPARNLISNIGFGEDATHSTGGSASPWANRPVFDMKFPLTHPLTMIPDISSEKIAQNTQYSPSLRNRIVMRLKNILWRSPRKARYKKKNRVEI